MLQILFSIFLLKFNMNRFLSLDVVDIIYLLSQFRCIKHHYSTLSMKISHTRTRLSHFSAEKLSSRYVSHIRQNELFDACVSEKCDIDTKKVAFKIEYCWRHESEKSSI